MRTVTAGRQSRTIARVRVRSRDLSAVILDHAYGAKSADLSVRNVSTTTERVDPQAGETLNSTNWEHLRAASTRHHGSTLTGRYAYDPIFKTSSDQAGYVRRRRSGFSSPFWVACRIPGWPEPLPQDQGIGRQDQFDRDQRENVPLDPEATPVLDKTEQRFNRARNDVELAFQSVAPVAQLIFFR